MPLLAVDTGAPRLQLALLRLDGTCDVLVEEMAQGQAERLFPAIEALLGRNHISYRDLTRLAVTSGPGSFTGLRIGLSAVRGLALALGIPAVGVPTLQALSLAGKGETTVIVDARRGESYVQRFSAPGVPLGPAMVLANAEAASPTDANATLVTSGFVDIAALAQFAAGVAPADYPPVASYVRGADAKPQEKFRVARVSDR